MGSTPDYNTPRLRRIASAANRLGGAVFGSIRPRPLDPSSLRSIVLLAFHRIGDMFLCLPLLEAVRSCAPQARIVCLAAPWNSQLLENHPAVDELRVLAHIPDVHHVSQMAFFNPATIHQLERELRRIRPDAVVDLQGNPMNVLAGFLARIPHRIGFERKLLNFLLPHRADYGDGIHQADVFFSLARVFGYDGPRPLPRIYAQDEEQRRVAELVASRRLQPFVVFHLGAGRSYRQWPLANFCELARRIEAELSGLRILVVGGSSDAELGSRLRQAAPGIVEDWSGRLNLRETYCLLHHAAGFVGNESSPAHLAGSQGVPTVMLMNEWSGVERWRALGPRVWPLTGPRIHPCPGVACSELPCPNMAAISPERVFALVAQFTAETAQRAYAPSLT